MAVLTMLVGPMAAACVEEAAAAADEAPDSDGDGARDRPPDVSQGMSVVPDAIPRLDDDQVEPQRETRDG
jgi:hypothetical protein